MKSALTAFRSVVLSILLFGLCSNITRSQDRVSSKTPFGVSLRHLSGVPGYRDGGIYLHETEPDDNVVVLPCFAFKPEKSDNSKILILEDSDLEHSGNIFLQITLDLYPQSVKQDIVNRLHLDAQNAMTKDHRSLFAHLTPDRISPPDITRLSITDVSLSPYKFVMVPIGDPSAASELVLRVSVPSASADDEKRRIQKGERVFRINYAVVGNAQYSSSQVRLTYEYLNNCGVLQDILGDATFTEKRSQWPTIMVGRRQRLELTSKLTSITSRTFDIQNTNDLVLLNQGLDEYMSQLFRTEVLKLDDSSWDRLSQFSYSHSDTTPDNVGKLVKKIHDDLKDKNQTQIDASHHGNVSMGDELGIKGDFGFDGKWLKDHAETHDIYLEEQAGKEGIWIPKGLKIYALNSAVLQKTGEIGTKINRSQRDLVAKEETLTTAMIVGDTNLLMTMESQLDKLRLIGAVVAFAGPTDGTTNIPSGWLLCDGRAVQRFGQFKSLFEVVGTTYGSGTNLETFNLPDYRGLFLRGASFGRDNSFADPSAKSRTNVTGSARPGPDQVGTLQMDELKTHNHKFNEMINRGQVDYARGVGTSKPYENYGGLPQNEHDARMLHISDYPGAPETRPKNIYVHYIISTYETLR